MGKFNIIRRRTIVEPTVFGVHCGYFVKIYNKAEFDAVCLNMVFVQDNESHRKRGGGSADSTFRRIIRRANISAQL